MKKMLLAAAAAVLISGTAVAASPEAFNVDVSTGANFRASPPTGSLETQGSAAARTHALTAMNSQSSVQTQSQQRGSGTWSRADSPSRNPMIQQASDDQSASPRKRPRRKQQQQPGEQGQQ